MIGSILITLVMAAAPADRVLASWDFVNGLQGWSTNGTTKVGHASGAMVIETDGRDPIVLSPPVSFVPEDGDLLEVRMSATRDGDIQWFYRTTTEGQYGGFRPDAQRLVPVGGGEKVQTYRAAMLWGGCRGGRIRAGPAGDSPEGLPQE